MLDIEEIRRRAAHARYTVDPGDEELQEKSMSRKASIMERGMELLKARKPIPGQTSLFGAGASAGGGGKGKPSTGGGRKTGEGSRGGRIIGHTKSGKPIYASSAKEGAKEDHKGKAAEHRDAHAHYGKVANRYGIGSEALGEARQHHMEAARAYEAGDSMRAKFAAGKATAAARQHHRLMSDWFKDNARHHGQRYDALQNKIKAGEGRLTALSPYEKAAMKAHAEAARQNMNAATTHESVASGSHNLPLAQMADRASDEAEFGASIKAHHAEQAQKHQEMASDHRKNAAYAGTDTPEGQKHLDAARAHADAIDMHWMAHGKQDRPGVRRSYEAAIKATRKAEKASDKAYGTGKSKPKKKKKADTKKSFADIDPTTGLRKSVQLRPGETIHRSKTTEAFPHLLKSMPVEPPEPEHQAWGPGQFSGPPVEAAEGLPVINRYHDKRETIRHLFGDEEVIDIGDEAQFPGLPGPFGIAGKY
jgi:hypothetical protein